MSKHIGVNLRITSHLHHGDRKSMEDEFQITFIQNYHDPDSDFEYAVFGIFDGHGGKQAASYVKEKLINNISTLTKFWSDNDEDVMAAIKEGFLQTHMAMWKELDNWPRTRSGWPSTSGTTASVAFIRQQKIYIGHVGDSRIVLGSEHPSGAWHGEALTRDHNPGKIKEKTRITECGGKVRNLYGVPRVVWSRPQSGPRTPVQKSTPMYEIPFLAIARSLGDFWSYNPTKGQFVVSPEPDVFVVPIDITRHRVLILGTDGLWNMFSNEQVVALVHAAEKNNENRYLEIPPTSGKKRLWENASKTLVAGALDRYSKFNSFADNIGVITVFLDPYGLPKSEVLLQQTQMLKGSPAKPTTRRPANGKENVTMEAKVTLYLLNQNRATRHKGNRGLQDNPQADEDFEINIYKKYFDSDPTIVRCSECGCANVHAVPSPSNESPFVNKAQNLPSNMVPNLTPSPGENALKIRLKTAPVRRTESKSEREDNQIHAVSSITLIPVTDRNGRGKTISHLDLPPVIERKNKEQTSVPSNNNKGWKNKDQKADTSDKDKTFWNPAKVDPGDRVLKSVNRGTSEHASQNVTRVAATPKRKRAFDLEPAQEPLPKSARLHARLHP